jgi:hypothetical protein
MKQLLSSTSTWISFSIPLNTSSGYSSYSGSLGDSHSLFSLTIIVLRLGHSTVIWRRLWHLWHVISRVWAMDVAHVAPMVAAGRLLSERGAGEEAEDGATLEVGLGKELLGVALWKRPLEKRCIWLLLTPWYCWKWSTMLLLLNFSFCVHSLINKVLQIVVWKHFNKFWNFIIKTMQKWYAHAFVTRVASCVTRSSRRIRELDNLSLCDLVKRQCTVRLSTRWTTETIALPRTNETAHAITPYRREGMNWVNCSSAFYNSLRNRKNKFASLSRLTEE